MLFASLDGCFDWTLFDLGVVNTIPQLHPELIHDLASWAGDLQQAANRIQNKIDEGNLSLQTLSNWTFQNIMDGNFGCDEADVIADVDAVNIADLYLTGPGRVSDALADYYGTTYSQYTRRQRFVNSVIHDKNASWSGSDVEVFRAEIYDALGLIKSGNNWVTSPDYTDSGLANQVKFSIAKKGGVNPSETVRKAVASKFSYYIYSLC